MQEMNKIDFANKDQVLKLYPPDHNKNPRPSFKSIMEGLRKLDVNPEEAVN